MRIDWEGEINGFWVHADYHFDFDDMGFSTVVVDKWTVFDDAGEQVLTDEPGCPDEEQIAQAIQEERDAA